MGSMVKTASSQKFILICKQKPDFFVFENVKGLYRTAKHREFFDGLKKKLHQVGYSCTENLINAIEYGAPQDRKRIILFGIREEKSVHINDFDWQLHATHPQALSSKWPGAQAIAKVREKPKYINESLTVQYWFDKNQVLDHPNAHHQFKPKAGLAKFEVIHEGDDSKK